MNRVDGLTAYAPPPGGIVLTIGNFDGMHLGHRRLIDTALAEARKLGAPVVAMTFEPHPSAILAPQRAPARLTTLHERLELLAAAGVETTIVLHTDRDLLSIAADDFLNLLARTCRPRVMVEGPTFNFGRGRAGSIVTLQEHAARLGYKPIIVDELYGRELGGNPPINSSAIRDAISDGRVADAAAMLGRPYRIVGVVGAGDGRGAGLGFPTANIEAIPHLLPAHAVYAAAAQLDDGTIRPAAVNIGPQPTFDQMTARVEAFVLEFDGPLRCRPLGLHLLSRLRGQEKFAGIDALVAQLNADVRRVREHADAIEKLRAFRQIGLTDVAFAA
jgi:riboflavin kinase/FMN adenylyltransferase